MGKSKTSEMQPIEPAVWNALAVDWDKWTNPQRMAFYRMLLHLHSYPTPEAPFLLTEDQLTWLHEQVSTVERSIRREQKLLALYNQIEAAFNDEEIECEVHRRFVDQQMAKLAARMVKAQDARLLPPDH